MNILVIDTSTEILVVAVRTDNDHQFVTSIRRGLRHTEYLMPTVVHMMGIAEITTDRLDLIVCSRGPGSFTGLRIGMATAKGLATPHDLPIVSIPSLDAMAFAWSAYDGVVVPVVDAKKKRVYSALYDAGRRITDYLDIRPTELWQKLGSCAPILVTGPFAQEVAAAAPGTVRCFQAPFAGESVAVAYAELGVRALEENGPDTPSQGPLYVRQSDAEIAVSGGRRNA